MVPWLIPRHFALETLQGEWEVARREKSTVCIVVYDTASRSVVMRGSEVHPNTTYYEKKQAFSLDGTEYFVVFLAGLPLLQDRPSLSGFTPNLTGPLAPLRGRFPSCFFLYCAAQSKLSCIAGLLGMLQNNLDLSINV